MVNKTHKTLIKLQNRFGKVEGRLAWNIMKKNQNIINEKGE